VNRPENSVSESSRGLITLLRFASDGEALSRDPTNTVTAHAVCTHTVIRIGFCLDLRATSEWTHGLSDQDRACLAGERDAVDFEAPESEATTVFYILLSNLQSEDCRSPLRALNLHGLDEPPDEVRFSASSRTT